MRFWFLVVFLGVAFLTGGSTAGDTMWVVILRPLAALWLVGGAASLTRDTIARYRSLLAAFALAWLLCLFELVPLPPAVWSSLPGRHIIEQVDFAAGLGARWRPFSMVPSETRNAAFALLVPGATLVHAIQMDIEEQQKILPALLLIAFVSALLGAVQVSGSAHSPFYLYSNADQRIATGLFSNPNHAATLISCIAPMIAGYIAVRGRPKGLSVPALLIPLAAASVAATLLTGSRAGIVTTILGILACPLLLNSAYPQAGGRLDPRRTRRLLTAASLVGLFLVIVAGLGAAWAHINPASGVVWADLRFRAWPAVLAAAWRYFPLGSGIGTFVEVYQIDEPSALLMPTYLNHAHNEPLELWMTGGVPAILLFGVALLALIRWISEAWRANPSSADITLARLGSIIIAILLAASVVEYPLRTPSLSCLAVLAVVWVMRRAPQPAPCPAETDPKNGNRYVD